VGGTRWVTLRKKRGNIVEVDRVFPNHRVDGFGVKEGLGGESINL